MSNVAVFSCPKCRRKGAWKEQLAGKRVKCKCGMAFTVPVATAAPGPENDAEYELAGHVPEASRQTVASSAPPPIPLSYQRAATAGERTKPSPKSSRSLLEIIFAQWPAALGFLLIGAGVLVACTVGKFGGYLSIRLAAILIAFGMVSLGYWTFANHNDDYNF